MIPKPKKWGNSNKYAILKISKRNYYPQRELVILTINSQKPPATSQSNQGGFLCINHIFLLVKSIK